MKENSPDCNCCGCPGGTWYFATDYYKLLDHISLFEKTTERTVHVDVSVTTEVFVGGALNSTETAGEPRQTTVEDPVVEEGSDSVKAAGRFQFEMVDDVSVTTASVITAGSVPSGDYTKVTTTTTTTVEEVVTVVRRLALRFDVSDYFRFDDDDPGGSPVVKAMTLLGTLEPYQIAGDIAVDDNVLEVELSAVARDLDLPVDAVEFDDQKAGTTLYTLGDAEISEDMIVSVPSAATATITLLFDHGDAEHGAIVKESMVAIFDRDPPPPDPIYDWHEDFERIADGEYQSLGAVAGNNMRFSLASLLPANFFGYPGAELSVEFYSKAVAGGDPEQVYFTQRFYMEPSTDLAPKFLPTDPDAYYWRIKSDGSNEGTIVHAVFQIVGWNTWPAVVSSQDPPLSTTFPNPPISYNLREEAIETPGGYRVVGGIREEYELVPFHVPLLDQPLPAMHLRFKISGADRNLDKITWTGIEHRHDSLNLDCPASGRCQLIDPYHHPEWRVVSLSVPGVSLLPAATSKHTACTNRISSAAADPSTDRFTILYAQGTWSAVQLYEPTVAEVYWPLGPYLTGSPPGGSHHDGGGDPFAPIVPYSFVGLTGVYAGYLSLGNNSVVVTYPPDYRELNVGGIAAITTVSPPLIYYNPTTNPGSDNHPNGPSYDDNPDSFYGYTGWVWGTTALGYLEIRPVAFSETQVGEEVLDGTEEVDVLLDDADGAFDVLISLEEPYPHAVVSTVVGPVAFQQTGVLISGATFGDGILLMPEPRGGATPDWKYIHQVFQPTYGDPFDAADVDVVQAWLSTADAPAVKYWYEVGGKYYSIDAVLGQEGPLDESEFVEPGEFVQVNVALSFSYVGVAVPFGVDEEATSWCTRSSFNYCLASYEFNAYPDSLPPGIPEPSPVFDSVKVKSNFYAHHPTDNLSNSPWVDSLGNQQNGVYPFRTFTQMWPWTSPPTIATTAGTTIQATPTGDLWDIVGSGYEAGSGEWPGTYEAAGEPELVMSGSEQLYHFEGCIGLAGGSLNWARVVPAWKGPNAPTLTFNGADRLNTYSTHYRVTNTIKVKDDSTEHDLSLGRRYYEMCVTTTRYSYNGVNLTIAQR